MTFWDNGTTLFKSPNENTGVIPTGNCTLKYDFSPVWIVLSIEFIVIFPLYTTSSVVSPLILPS